MFFQGSLQDGILLALNERRAVVCFVRDDTPTSSKWENDFFTDDELARLLQSWSVTLRLEAGSREAQFLTSVCPISKFPAVVIIKNGMLQEYVVPEITKDDFCRRIGAVLGNRSLDRVSEVQQQDLVTSNTNRTPSTSALPTPAPATSSPLQQPQPATRVTHVIPETAESQHSGQMQAETQPAENVQASQDGTITLKPSLESKKDPPKKTKPKQNTSSVKKIYAIQGRKEVRISPASPAIDKPVGKSTSESPEEQVKQTPALRAPPSKYRLQVRLFDGTSVRSSFSPSHTIRGDVRPWLGDQLPDKTQPYNLKHILTPLPNYTLSVMDEEKTLQELSLGPTANLVMVPIQSYANAYAPSALSLPVRGARTFYGLASSIVGGLMGLASSFYVSPSVPSENASCRNTGSESPSGDEVRRAGQPTASQRPRIRTLRDQRDDERSDNEFYNGNQLNFEPRRD